MSSDPKDRHWPLRRQLLALVPLLLTVLVGIILVGAMIIWGLSL